jgi:hypothetical protein
VAGIPQGGKLIRPILVEIERIDPAATAAAGQYNHVLKEPIPQRANAGRANEQRTDGMVRRPPIKILAQMERGPFMALNMVASGNAASSNLRLVLHRRDLTKRGLLLADGLPDFHVGDRILATYTRWGKLIAPIPDPPGLYCTQVQPAGEGLGGNQNLVVLYFDHRDQAVPGG